MIDMELTEVTLKMIIDSGLLKPNTIIYSDSNPLVNGKLTNEGSIVLTIDNITKTYFYPSGAARFVVKVSVNGWIFWKVKVGNEMKQLSYFRELYKKS